MTAPLPRVTLTTDGAAIDNPGPGGWAVLVEYETTEQLLSGPGPETTTNNRMELKAVIEGLRALTAPHAVLLRADSQYVLNGIEQLLGGRALLPEMANADLWYELAEQMTPHSLTWEWVKGHADDERNERVDRAATTQAQTVRASSATYQTEQQHIDHIIESLQLTPRWTLVVAAPPATWPGQWRLYTPDDIVDGRVRERNPAVAAWRAFIAGLNAAVAYSEDEDEAVDLDVLINADVVVKQTSGIWRVQHPSLIPLFAEWGSLQTSFNEVVVLRASDAQVMPLVVDPADEISTPAPVIDATPQSVPPAGEAAIPMASAPTWTLVVRSGRPVQWDLNVGYGKHQGQVAVQGVTEPVAVWQACRAGLEAAARLSGATHAAVRVITNYELLVKQATGTWQINKADIEHLFVQVQRVHTQFQSVTYEWLRKDELAQLLSALP